MNKYNTLTLILIILYIVVSKIKFSLVKVDKKTKIKFIFKTKK